MDIDLVLDIGTRRVPVEIKSAETVAADFFVGLDHYCLRPVFAIDR